MIISRMTRYYVLSQTKPLNNIENLLRYKFYSLKPLEKSEIIKHYHQKYQEVFIKILYNVADIYGIKDNVRNSRKTPLIFARMAFVDIATNYFDSKVDFANKFRNHSSFFARVTGRDHATILHWRRNFEEYSKYKDFQEVQKLVINIFNDLINK